MWNISINVAANLPKHFVKCLYPLSKPFTKHFRKVSENYPVIIVRTFKATFLAILQKIFVQVYGNIGSRSLWPRYQYFQKTLQDFVYCFEYLNRKLAWNIWINVSENLSQYCFKNYPIIKVWIFWETFQKSFARICVMFRVLTH